MSKMLGDAVMRGLGCCARLVWVAAVTLSGCASDSSVVQTTALDGVADLTEDDLEPGAFTAVLTYTPPGESGESFELRPKSKQAEIFYDGGALICPRGWGVRLQVSDARVEHDFAVMLWFEDPNLEEPDMTEGSGNAVVLSVDIPEIEQGGRDRSVDPGPVVVTSSDGSRASGWYKGHGEVGVARYALNAEATGERFVLHALAFRDIATQKASRDVSDCSFEESATESNACPFLVDDQCFESAEAACESYGCSISSCNVLTTIPARIECD